MNILGIPVIIYTNNFPGSPLDQSCGLIKKLSLENDINNANWGVIEKKIMDLSADEMSRALDGICTTEKFHPHIESYLKTESTEFQNVLAGVYYTIMAWKARSGSWAKEVGEDQWRGFFEYLEEAHESLKRPFQSKKLKLEGTARLIRVYLGLSEKEEAYQAFKACQELSLNHFVSHISYCRVLVPRWLGSEEELLSFADSVVDSKLKLLINLMALVDLHSDLNNEDEDSALQRFRSEHGERIQNNLQQASNISSDDNIVSITTRNYLAYLYNVLEMKKDRNRMLNTLKGKITAQPWGYAGVRSERDLKLFKLGGVL